MEKGNPVVQNVRQRHGPGGPEVFRERKTVQESVPTGNRPTVPDRSRDDVPIQDAAVISRAPVTSRVLAASQAEAAKVPPRCPAGRESPVFLKFYGSKSV